MNRARELHRALIRDLRRFSVELLCLLMVLSGAPLQALGDAPPEGESAEAEAQLDAAPPDPPRSRNDGDRGVETTPKTTLAVAPPEVKSHLEGIPLYPGYNLLSLPEEPPDPDPAAVFAPIDGSYVEVFAHDVCDQDDEDGWQRYIPSDPAASDLLDVDPTMGLWIEATAPAVLPSDGTLPATTSWQLCRGWNLIGFPAAQPRPVRSALQSIDGKYVRIFGYDASDADDPWEIWDVAVPDWANDLRELRPGYGYWLRITPDGITHSSGRGVDFERDAAGRIVAITDPLGQIHEYRYDPDGDLETSIDRAGGATHFEYTDGHYLERILTADGSSRQVSWDAAGRVTAQVDEAGEATRFHYDEAGRLERVEVPGTGEVQIERDAAGRVTRLTDALGQSEERSYTPAGRIASVTDALGRSWRYRYGPSWMEVEDPLGRVEWTEFGGEDEIGRIVHADGTEWHAEYLDGAPVGETDAYPTAWINEGDDRRTFAHNALGQLESSTDLAGAAWSYGYAPSGSLTSVTAPTGEMVQELTHDARGRVSPGGGPTGASSPSATVRGPSRSRRPSLPKPR